MKTATIPAKQRFHACRPPAVLLLAGALACSIATSGCLGGTPGTPTAAETAAGSNGATSPGFSSSDSTQAFRKAGAVKVIFNKTGFHSSTQPNSSGCPGDARLYFDPLTDRQVPTKPDWLKNVAVEITNANALNGPSRATGCGLSGIGSAPAANCASFDDLMPLDGSKSRSFTVGGFGCVNGTASCAADAIVNDIWQLGVPDNSTSVTWSQQSSGLPQIAGMPAAPGSKASGQVWHSGGYDELHDQFYTFGGATPNTLAQNGAGIFNNSVVRITFNSDGNVSTLPAPALPSQSSRRFYAGWAKAGAFDTAIGANFPVPAMVGSAFTYGLRRDPSMKSQCARGESPTSFTCSTTSSSLNTASSAIAVNEHQDYFLLTGGMPSTGMFSKNIYVYTPHGHALDIGTAAGGTPLERDGNWMLMSNVTGSASVSSKVMSVVDISTSVDGSTTPFTLTSVSGTRPAGDTFLGWLGRAFHRAVYDPGMNRFYIYGGLENKTGPLAATTTAPDLATSDVWIYDPPALGRRPTSTCFTNETPFKQAAGNFGPLPAASSVTSPNPPMQVSKNLDANRAYTAGKFAFPPGGCLQRIKNDLNMPPARFEHGLAFDRDSKVMFVFGGCNNPGIVRGNNVVNAGSPLVNCNGQALLNDLWMYVPPRVTEPMPQTWRTSQASPFNASSLLGNIFGTDFWLDHLPMFAGNNDPNSGSLTEPLTHQVVGTWIRLRPPTNPPPRASAGFVYDRSHHKLYLQGGWGCRDVNCTTSPQALNDLWEYSPPSIEEDCSFETGVCGTGGATGQGTWTQVRPNIDVTLTNQPPQRFGSIMAHANPLFSHGDEYYTVTDNACQFQGPIATTDSSVNKQFVGAIYIDIDRDQLTAGASLLLNIRMLPYDKKTKLPGFFDNNTIATVDDSDVHSSNDSALVRVQLLSNPLRIAEQIQASIQPRYHEFISGTPVIVDSMTYVAGPTGQVTEKQIHIPLGLDSSINLIKIERIQGSMKFFEMTISKF